MYVESVASLGLSIGTTRDDTTDDDTDDDTDDRQKSVSGRIAVVEEGLTCDEEAQVSAGNKGA